MGRNSRSVRTAARLLSQIQQADSVGPRGTRLGDRIGTRSRRLPAEVEFSPNSLGDSRRAVILNPGGDVRTRFNELFKAEDES
jgi:hypothetical protein